MLTVTKPDYTSVFPFEKYIGLCLKNEMAFVASLLDLPIKKSLKKELFLTEMARQLIQQVPELLKKFPTYEVELLSRVLDAPKGVGVQVPGFIGKNSMLITQCCFVVCRQISDAEWQYFLVSEAVRGPLTLAVAEAKRYQEQHPYVGKCERLALGMMNYFGCVPDIFVFKRCCNLLNENGIKASDIVDVLDYPLFRMCRQIAICDSLPESSQDYKKDMLISPMVEEVGFILEEQSLHPGVHPDYLSVPEEVLLAYGTMPYVKPLRPGEKAMYDYLKSCRNLDKEKADYYYTKLWYQVQRDQKLQDCISSLSDCCQFESIAEVQKVMNLLSEFSNNTPKWILSGLSSQEVYEKYEKPRMRNLPNMPFPSAFPSSPFMPQPKVGRNDPCPCGSGKKYKHCCGK